MIFASDAALGTLTSMLVLAGQIFAALLVATGVAKLRRPTDTARALSALGLPFPKQVVFIVAVLEIAIGGAAMLTPASYVFAGQAVLYAIFTGWVISAIRSDVPIASCGCLGRDDTPPSWAHIGVDLMALAASIGAVATFSSRPDFDGLALIAAVFVVAAGAGLAWMVLGDAAVSLARKPT